MGVVLAAVQENVHGLKYAAPHVQTEIKRMAATAGMGLTEYAHALSHPVAIIIQSVKRLSDSTMRVHFSTLGGATDTIDVDGHDENTTLALRAPLAAAQGVSVASLS